MYIRVEHPSGRCYAAQHNNNSLPEWPVHPSRLYSAMVASAYRNSCGMTDRKRSVLEWFESLPAPSIHASPADLSPAPVSYVPPADSIGRKGKKGEELYEHAVHRWRQPRAFPYAILLGEPASYYGWQEDPEPEMLSLLDSIARGVTHLGTSHAFVIVSVHRGPTPRKMNFIPHPQGNQFFRTTCKGRLQELDAIFDSQAKLRRPIAACEPVAAYRNVGMADTAVQPKGPDLIALRLTGSMHGADTAPYVARALRRAVMSVLGDKSPAAVHGHNFDSHVAWLPLPDVGHRHAKGRIIGVGVALPPQMSTETRRCVLSGLNQVRRLRLPDGRIAKLEPVRPGEPIPHCLQRYTWIRPANTWSTVTPVILDRPPKRSQPERLQRALVQSLRFAGYPQPQHVELSAFSRFEGAPPSFTVPATKPRYHATIHFKEAVQGPIIAGRLRYFGVGLFRPLPSFEKER